MAAHVMGVNASLPLHPYYPADAVMPGYVANTLGSRALRASFAVCAAGVLAPALHLIKKRSPNLSNANVATALWFVLCGFIHFFFEGYFAYNQSRMPTLNDLFGMLWKEYSLSDSRYLTQDSFLVCMETVTAVCWGPLSFACAWCIVAGHPLRHPLQTVISLGQIYGAVLYFATCSFDKVVARMVYCRPEDWYFWCYYVFMNAIWIVVPGLLLGWSVVETQRAFARVAEVERSGKKNL